MINNSFIDNGIGSLHFRICLREETGAKERQRHGSDVIIEKEWETEFRCRMKLLDTFPGNQECCNEQRLKADSLKARQRREERDV